MKNPSKKKPLRSNKLKTRWKVLIALGCVVVVLLGAYLTFVYSQNPFIAKWRNIYIETAMSTMKHQWLATSFIPANVVDEVMDKAEQQHDSQGGLHSSWDMPTGPVKPPVEDVEGPDEERELFYQIYWELERDSFEAFLSEHPELLENGYFGIQLDNLGKEYKLSSIMDEAICVLNAPENLLILEISGNDYKGKMAVVKDPAQVTLLKSPTLGEYGTLLGAMAKQKKAILAINCSGFADIDWKGDGSVVIGSVVIDGVDYGRPNDRDKLFGFKADDRLYIDKYSEEAVAEYRWAAQFSPALIVDGEVYVQGTFGLGLQPRSAIGQAKNGDVLLLIIDGRQVGHSVGCTVSDLAEIMLRHDAYQAMNLDGGSSALMWYNGKEITRASSTTSIGRYLPDAIAVMPAASLQ